LGKIIQNTTQFSLDSLSLLVSLDSKGMAKGILYEDAGEGFQYKKGEYLISCFEAIQKGSTIKVTIKRIEGNLKPINRNYKVTMVKNNNIVESVWTKDSIISVRSCK